MPDSYSAIILCEFPLFFCMHMWYMEFSEISEKHIKTGFSQLHSLYCCSTTRNTPLPPPIPKNSSSVAFVVQIGKKSSGLCSLIFETWTIKLETCRDCIIWEITLIIFLLWELQKKKFDRRGRERLMLWVGEQL